jgi:hypothetical protein
VAFSQVIPCGPEALIQLHVVGVEHGIDISTPQIRSPAEEKIEKVPTPCLQGHVEGRVPLQFDPIAPAQKENRE